MKRKKILRFSISRSKFDVRKVYAMAFVKRGHPMVSTLLRSLLPLGGHVSPNWVRVVVLFLRDLNKLNKKSGLPFVVKYLKGCSVLTQQVAAGYKISDLTDLGVRISRSKSGLPRIIPVLHRKMIRQGDQLVIRFWLTIFNLYRDLHFQGEFKIKSIIAPSVASSRITDIHKYINDFTSLWGNGLTENLYSHVNLSPFYSSGPQVSRKEKQYNSHPSVVLRSIKLFMNPKNKHLFDSLKVIMDYCNNSPLRSLVDYLVKGRTLLSPISPYLGRLSIKKEAAGKVRVFAMVDPITQWALTPLHKCIFSLLRKIPMDGTFDQHKVLLNVPFGKMPLYSFDLSSATDRLPISLQEAILGSMFSPEFASAWSTLLVGREYKLPSNFELRGTFFSKELPPGIKYSVGQPMGALSSWAMLALTHHYILQYAAWIRCVVPVGTWFSEYGVLGDDIIIWNKTVADQYLVILKTLGVEVGLAKSIISLKGEGVEFAKRTIIKGKDVSPIPFQEMSSAHRNFSNLRAFLKKYNMSPTKALRFLGYGYKVDITKMSRPPLYFKMALQVPLNELQFRALFNSFLLDRPYFEFRMKHFIPKIEIQKTLFLLVWKELNKLHKISSKYFWDLVAMSAAMHTAASGPWQTKEARIIRDVNQVRMSRAISDLERIKSNLKSKIISLDHWHWLFTSPYYSIPFTMEGQPFNSEMTICIKLMFEADNLMSRIQVDSMLSPKYKPPYSVKFEEERRNLELWEYWSTMINKSIGSPIFITNRPLL